MPRTVRIQYAGAIYHVLCRGDRQERIFTDERDREIFLGTLAQMCGRTGARIHSYVLMSNHYHLLLETPEPNLVAGMKWFQGTYTQRFNLRHRHGGHLFQGRYKAIPVEPEEPAYFHAVSEYIHLNPARARLLGEAGDLLSYRWSSYPAFVQARTLPAWLCRSRVFDCLDLAQETASARRRYQGWMSARTRDVLAQEPTAEEEEAWRQLRRGWYVGTERFRDRLLEAVQGVLAGRKRRSYRAEGLQRHDEGEAERLLAAGLAVLELSTAEATRLRCQEPRKQGLAWLLKRHTVVGNEWISTRLAMGHRANIARAVAAYERAPTRAHRRLRDLLQQCAH